ncbi:hypothetical protein DFR30_0081 [Thiogranum longum]|uniref:MSHA biogenesis protein MshK n=1 Tax=Thiogranum longum TaxID=1537524 RepID=A0A4R1HI31_9GAMM|nr:hypothetical protein [Thiogranum longum]TCK16862.1 hypothetical protein DFR30_0081 [Thiogranum longum]
MRYSNLALSLIFLLTPCATALADPWGLLFTTPNQRARLDSGQAEPAPSASSSSGGSRQESAVEPIQLTGTLTSNRGKRTAWINGKPASRDVRVLGAGRVQLYTPSSESPLLIKSGQRLNPQTGEIVEGYTAPPEAVNATAQTETDTADAPM